MEYKFTKDVLGSTNGYDVQEYKEGQIVDEKDLNKYLIEGWTENKTIVKAGKAEKEEKPEAKVEEDDEIPEDLSDDAKDFLNGETDKLPDDAEEITEEELKELAKELLKEEEPDAKRLKEIGVALKINGMATTTKPEKIVKKIADYLE